jgi:hypothetical protein
MWKKLHMPPTSFLRNVSTSIQGGSGIAAEMPKILRRE